ncbi:MAG: hypothetical protein WC119_01015 [Synergistaceae bacterium]
MTLLKWKHENKSNEWIDNEHGWAINKNDVPERPYQLLSNGINLGSLNKLASAKQLAELAELGEIYIEEPKAEELSQ